MPCQYQCRLDASAFRVSAQPTCKFYVDVRWGRQVLLGSVIERLECSGNDQGKYTGSLPLGTRDALHELAFPPPMACATLLAAVPFGGYCKQHYMQKVLTAWVERPRIAICAFTNLDRSACPSLHIPKAARHRFSLRGYRREHSKQSRPPRREIRSATAGTSLWHTLVIG